MKEFNIKKILVPVDFSPASLNALDTAVALARRHRAGLLLLNVVETVGLSGMHAHNVDEVTTVMTHHAEQELLALQHSVLERFLVPCEVACSGGIVSSVVLKTCAGSGADLIVMGTHGAGGFRDSFIGLNAFNVIKNAACPVLTIPPGKKFDTFKKILFPVRPLPSALEKYELMRSFIRREDASLKLLGLAVDYEKEVDILKKLTNTIFERLKRDEVDASSYFKIGEHMEEEVLKIAGVIEADLIIITATIDSSYQQLFVSPYTQHIINHSRVPVLSVKASGEVVDAEDPADYDLQSFAHNVALYN
jgi:nucleotide-binding universal stress UspA family protein